MIVKLLIEHHLEFLSLKGGCTGSSESTCVKMSHCRKSHVTAHVILQNDDIVPTSTSFDEGNTNYDLSSPPRSNTDKVFLQSPNPKVSYIGKCLK